MEKKTKRTIEVEELELVDDQGRTRALLSTHQETGLPFLAFYDEERRQRVLIGLDIPNRAVLSMIRANGRVFAGCGEDDEGGVGLALCDDTGKPGVMFNIHPDGERSIQVLDPGLKVIWASPSRAARASGEGAE